MASVINSQLFVGRHSTPAAHRSARRPVAAHAAQPRTYRVTFQLPGGQEEHLNCPADQYILDAVQASDLELPFECTAGGCSSCAGRVLSGSVDQSDQQFLDPEQISQGFAMLCTSYPTSDCVIQINHA